MTSHPVNRRCVGHGQRRGLPMLVRSAAIFKIEVPVEA
jgi:hypothetical protein